MGRAMRRSVAESRRVASLRWSAYRLTRCCAHQSVGSLCAIGACDVHALGDQSSS